MAAHPIPFFAVVVTNRPDDEDHAPEYYDQAAVRFVLASEVTDEHLILASPLAGDEQRADVRPRYYTDYFNVAYPASPQAYDPECGCPGCTAHRDIHPDTPTVVLSGGWPWECCDPWPADSPVLVALGALDITSAHSRRHHTSTGRYLTRTESAAHVD